MRSCLHRKMTARRKMSETENPWKINRFMRLTGLLLGLALLCLVMGCGGKRSVRGQEVRAHGCPEGHAVTGDPCRVHEELYEGLAGNDAESKRVGTHFPHLRCASSRCRNRISEMSKNLK